MIEMSMAPTPMTLKWKKRVRERERERERTNGGGDGDDRGGVDITTKSTSHKTANATMDNVEMFHSREKERGKAKVAHVDTQMIACEHQDELKRVPSATK